MKKNNQVFSEPNLIEIIDIDKIDVFANVSGMALIELTPNSSWTNLKATASSIRAKCELNDAEYYEVELLFRIPHANIELLTLLSSFTYVPIVAKYISASKVPTIVGSLEHPLRFDFWRPDGYDGYYCRIWGEQGHPELFVIDDE